MNDKNIVVSLIEPVGGHGGNEFYDFGLCEFLYHEKIDVTLYTCDETILDEKHSFNFRIMKSFKKIYGTSNKLVRGFRFIKGSIFSVLDAKRQFSELAHFHIYHFSILELFNILLFRLFRIKCIATIHDVHSFDKYGEDREELVSFKTKFILKICSKLIVHSTLAKKALEDIGVIHSKINYVPHGDTDFIYNKNQVSQKNAQEFFGVHKKDKFVLLFFGQIKAVKGLDILLQAMPLISDEVVLYVIGKCWKQDLDDYLQIVNKLNINDRVFFKNEYINNEDVPYFFWGADAICLPYKKIYSSGVVLRAMDYGCPVICSDLPPLKSVVTDGVTGLIFESENLLDLANRINHLVKNPKIKSALSESAKNFIDENYSWSVVAQATKKVYKEIL